MRIIEEEKCFIDTYVSFYCNGNKNMQIKDMVTRTNSPFESSKSHLVKKRGGGRKERMQGGQRRESEERERESKRREKVQLPRV